MNVRVDPRAFSAGKELILEEVGGVLSPELEGDTFPFQLLGWISSFLPFAVCFGCENLQNFS